MFWTTLCGRRVADGRWWTYWLAAPGCSSACDRKPLTCPAVFCSSVAGANKFEEAPQSEAARFRAIGVDPVVHRVLREVGQPFQPQSRLQRPDIIPRIEAASAATPG